MANFLILSVINMAIIVAGSWPSGYLNFSNVGIICSKRYSVEQSTVIEHRRFEKSERTFKSVQNLNKN